MDNISSVYDASEGWQPKSGQVEIVSILGVTIKVIAGMYIHGSYINISCVKNYILICTYVDSV